MLLVKAKVDKSPIHGLGLFAEQDIPQGTRIWQRSDLVDLAIDPSRINEVPLQIRELTYLCRNTNQYVLSADGSQYMNHADKPNIIGDIAVRDITKGEELTENYGYEYGEIVRF